MNQQPFLKSGLISLLAGISATAAFATTGFIAAFGREQFLGTNLSNWSIQTLTILAGRFAADSFFLVLNLGARYWIALIVCFVLIGVGVVLSRLMKVPAWLAHTAESLLAVPLLIWLLIIIATIEVPTVPLRGWILATNSESPLSTAIRQLHPKVSKASLSTYSQYVQTAVAKTGDSPAVTRLEDYHVINQSSSPGVLLLEASSNDVSQQMKSLGFEFHYRENAKNLLYSRYAMAVSVCLLAFLYIVLMRQSPQSKLWCDLLLVLRTSVMVTFAVATLLLPYVYGKLIDSTLFPDAFVTYTERSTSDAGGKDVLKSGEFPLISQSDTSLSLLWIQGGGGHTKIIEVPRANIVKLDLEADVDALAKIAQCVTKPDGNCQ
jgi:hypothetical protein